MSRSGLNDVKIFENFPPRLEGDVGWISGDMSPITGQSFPIPCHSQDRTKNADLVTLEI